MARKLRILGIALVAVLAMSSLLASAALATNDAFVSESAPVTLTGGQHSGNNKFILAGSANECTTGTLSATVNSTTVTEITTEAPVLSGCSYAGQPATVTMNGCGYILTGTTDVNGDAQAKVDCPEGKTIQVTLNAAKCLVTIASQTAEEGYTITTVGSGSTKELTLHLTLKVKVTTHGHPTEGITCASLTNGSGTLEGTSTVTGENEVTGAHIGITDETV